MTQEQPQNSPLEQASKDPVSIKRVAVVLGVGFLIALLCFVNTLVPEKKSRVRRIYSVNNMQTVSLTITNADAVRSLEQPGRK